jgi:hypothetical protein
VLSGTARRCSRCGLTKPGDEFAGTAGIKVDTYCRPCRSEYGKAHYAANRQRYIEAEARRKRARAEERIAFLIEFFRTHPCVDCGETDPLVLEFDHLRDKHFNIGKQFSSRSWQKILEEMEKCDVVCANCHRRRTARRHGTVRALLVEGRTWPPTPRTYNRLDAGEV